MLEDDDDVGIDTLVKSILKNKKNGFTRANPATYAEKVKDKQGTPNFTPKHDDRQENVSSKAPRTPTKFCYYINNYGTCKFENNNGRKC